MGGRTYAIDSHWQFGGIRASGSCNGQPFTAQVERHGLWLRVEHNGLRIDAQVMSARAAELLRLMPFKAPPDMSHFLLSPMPGLLADIVVKPGQAVQAGERLAVIEAMKMENILTAAQDGTVAEVLAAQGREPGGGPADPAFCLKERIMSDKPFRILGVQQIAIGGPDKQRLQVAVGRHLRPAASRAPSSASARTSTRTSARWARARMRSRST